MLFINIPFVKTPAIPICLPMGFYNLMKHEMSV